VATSTGRLRGVFLRAIAWIGAFSLCACGGGGGGSHPGPAAIPVASPVASSTPLPMGHATVTITIPAAAITANARKNPAFISASAQSISISSYPVVAGVIAGVAAATSNQNLTSTSPGCSGTGPIVCSVSVAAPLGRDAFAINIYQGLNQGLPLLSTLPQSAATELTVVEGQANTVLPLVLGGVPASIVVSPSQTALFGGVPATIGISVVASDAGGNVIIGSANYANPITLTDVDGTGQTGLSTFTVVSPATVVTLNYTGQVVGSTVTINASATGATVTPGLLTFSPGALTVACSSGCSGLPNPNSAYTETISEGGYGSNVFTYSGSGASCNFNPVGAVTAVGGVATVNVYPSPLGGTCTLLVSDMSSQTRTATLTYNPAGPPVVSSYRLPIDGTYPPIPADGNNSGLDFTVDCCPDAPPPAYPIVLWGAYSYWPLSYASNPDDLGIVFYGSTNSAAVGVLDNVAGTRYIQSISVDTVLQLVTWTGQGGSFALTPFAQLLP
jgi:hypothetical protein